MSVTGFMRVPKLAPDYKLLLFFGSPRAGSTLLGQILNNHPNALVANEYRLLQKIVREGRDLEKQLRKLRQTAWRHYKSGLKKDRYFSDKLSKFQPRWIEFDRSQKRETLNSLVTRKPGGTLPFFLNNRQEPKTLSRNIPHTFSRSFATRSMPLCLRQRRLILNSDMP